MKKPIEYWRSAVALGNALAKSNLGDLLRARTRRGNGPQSRQGSLDAQCNLRKRRRRGAERRHGVKYFEEAAKQGNPRGQFKTSMFYHLASKTMKCTKLAAKQGDPEATAFCDKNKWFCRVFNLPTFVFFFNQIFVTDVSLFVL